MYKNLTFSLPFEKLEESLEFKAARIHAFGFNAYKPSHEELYPQVSILDYQSEDDFVIELKSRSEGDRIILAKIQPRGSLADTVTLVRDRVTAGKPQAAVRGDVLIVPRMSFDITRRYSEIENRRLIPKNTKLPKDLSLLSAVQNTRFEMNEKGVELRSEAHMAFGCSAREVPVPKHRMIFDKPFLVVLERAGAKTPYFALWVDNSELLVTW